MITYTCQCENRLFFDNRHCEKCQSAVGLCTSCGQVNSINSDTQGSESTHCGNSSCGVPLQRCSNGIEHDICNVWLDASTDVGSGRCKYCSLTRVIPSLAISGNLAKWRRLESAKRRVLYIFDQIGLEYRQLDNNGTPKLSFEFKADRDQPVSTGHADGCIVINLKESDSIHREIARQEFGEPQRTMVGHFRHELGHFFWDQWVKGQDEPAFVALFGDHQNPNYSEALDNYYATGASQDWRENFISAYATMHPWEDFAETFAAWADMISVMITAGHFEVGTAQGENFDITHFEQLIDGYAKIGMVANEFNRDLGLLDLVPEVFNQSVIAKLKYVHSKLGSAIAGTPPAL